MSAKNVKTADFKELYVIGDAKSFLRIKNAISEGYVTAWTL
jgi:hypothetical protein